MTYKLPLALALTIALTPFCALAQSDELRPSGRFSVQEAPSAATPPMGWNPWNAFRTEVDEGKILASAEKIRSAGLLAAGYHYINLDDGWWLRRGEDGRIVIRTAIFPSAKAGADGRTSFRPLTDRLHGMGFKAGLYTDAGKNTCSQHWDRHSPNLPEGTMREREVGLDGFEYQDLRVVFQEWGFDYLKVDACGLADYAPGDEVVVEDHYRPYPVEFIRGKPEQSNLDLVETRYARIARALRDLNPDNDFVLAICVWGEADSRTWAGRHGNLWRTSKDIEPHWESMLHNVDSTIGREMYAGPGRWNDPDMMAIGLGDFDGRHLTEARSHFSLWSILSAPLLMGFDLTKAPQPILDILGNREVIAINQDPAGNQATRVYDRDGVQILVKSLAAPGERAVAVFNRGDKAADVVVDWRQLKLRGGSDATVRDLWARRDLSSARDSFKVRVGPRETRLYKISGTSIAGQGVLLSEMPGRINVAEDGVTVVAADVTKASGGARADSSPMGEPIRLAGKTHDYGVGIQANSRMEVATRGEFRRFTAQVGVDEGSSSAAQRVIFKVYGDGKLLFQTQPLARGDAPASLDVEVAGVRTLELVADAGKPLTQPLLTAWADARLEPMAR